MVTNSYNRLILIGLPASGKSTVSKLLSQKLSIPLFELDELIESKYAVSIGELFEKNQESYFRLLETQCLKNLSQKSLPQQYVLSTGGGILSSAQNVSLLKSLGDLIYLKAQTKIIFDRMTQCAHPLLKNKTESEMIEILEQRLTTYQQADLVDLVIDTLEKSCHLVCKEILKKITKPEDK